MDSRQHTLSREVSFSGIGLHSGLPIAMVIKPAPANSGVRFVRTDLAVEIPALMNRVVDTTLATTIGEGEAMVSTTEHLLAALAGLAIDNVLIELNGPEVPIMDGSAGPFVHLLNKLERRPQEASRRMIKITRELSCVAGDSTIRVSPHEGYRVSCEIDFEHPSIRRQRYSLEVTPKRFVKEIASARTFGFVDQVERLRANGLALGGSLANAVVMGEEGVLNAEGLRFSDEFVRHKVLDLIGDLALIGCPLLGHVVASKPGHGLHLSLMKELVAHPECWEFVVLEEAEEEGVFGRVVTSTVGAGNMILPFLVPARQQLASSSSMRG
ncbi:MAG: UDP-3-O-acyl-N-acetylglucosamine deacetylase [Desulfobulbaceae bacterium]|nr:UDP-3-O-acyl-N-acetylglucosamine deacetylase [Desulfobulbaceae bacterium]